MRTEIQLFDPANASGFQATGTEKNSATNPCKEQECNACCQNMIMLMTLKELAIFSQQHVESGGAVAELPRKSVVTERGRALPHFYGKTSIWYAANASLEKHLKTNKHGDTQAVVLLEGVCPNNKNGECTIYDKRPTCCQKLKKDSSQCRACQVEIKNDTRFIPLREVLVGYTE